MASEEQQWSIFDWVRNPPEVYAKMRASGPIHWNEDYKGWLVIDYDLARELLKDPRLSSDTTEALKLTAFPKRSREQVEPLLDLLRSWLIFSDPPYHTALRKVLNPYFAKSALAERAKSIEMHARNLLSNCEGEWDFMEKFAGPLPARVMADLMGLPYDAILDFLSWDAQLASFIGSAVRSPDVTAGALMAMRYQKQFFNQVIAAAAPDSFLVSLKSALEQEDLFSKDDFWKILSMILATGTETTRNLIGSGMFALLSNPEQYQLLQQKPELLDSAIDECLRFYSPVQSVFRLATDEIAINDIKIEKGHYVRIILGAINRDPNSFENPDRFDITRNPNKHLSFGAGVHFCLGQVLARLEAQIVFPIILEKFPQLQLVTQDPEWVGGTTFRGIESFFVKNQ